MNRELVRLIKEWNGGVWRGAVTKFAKKLGISTTAVSNWSRNRVRMDEDNIPKVAKELGIPSERLTAVIRSGADLKPADHDQLIPLYLRKTIVDLLTKKKELAGVTLSTELYMEGLLLGLVNESGDKTLTRTEGELAPRSTHGSADKRKIA